jgi:8-oxo-dGTP pyrophosphatase MutT (NUDIX family)
VEPTGTPLPDLLARLQRVLERRGGSHRVPAQSGRRAAGVLVPFFIRAGELRLLMFRRTDQVPTHKNQVAFPGGSREEEDRDLLETAIREAREEVGIDSSRLTHLGPLQPFDTRVNQFVVSPFCAFLHDPDPVFMPQPFEVEALLELPLAELRDRRTRHLGKVPGFSVPIPLPYYRLQGAIVWGVSGAIVGELLDALAEAERL